MTIQNPQCVVGNGEHLDLYIINIFYSLGVCDFECVCVCVSEFVCVFVCVWTCALLYSPGKVWTEDNFGCRYSDPSFCAIFRIRYLIGLKSSC